MIKTFTIDTDKWRLVPKGMMYELPELPMPIKGKFSKDLFDGVQMHKYAMRYLDEALAAAPQPEPNHNWCAGCSPDNCSGCGTFYEIKKQRDELLAFAEEVRRSGDTRLASMAIAAIASVKELK